MATLTGKLADVTSKTPENISSITVKAPSVRVGSGTDVIVSSPATVDFNRSTGDVTISGLTGGLSWLYIEGDGWSDSIALSVAEGMVTLVEAVANAAGIPALAEYINLLIGLQNRLDEIALDAVNDALANNSTDVIGSSGTTHANKYVKLDADGDLYISTDSIVKSSDPVNKNYVDTAKWLRRTVLQDEDLNDLTDTGVYIIPLSNTMSSLKNRPFGSTGPGFISVANSAGTVIQELTNYSPNGPITMSRTTQGGVFQDWVNPAAATRSFLWADMNDAVIEGDYDIERYADVRDLVNRPPASPIPAAVRISVRRAGGARLIQDWVGIITGGIGERWQRNRNSAGVWEDWVNPFATKPFLWADMNDAVAEGDYDIGRYADVRDLANRPPFETIPAAIKVSVRRAGGTRLIQSIVGIVTGGIGERWERNRNSTGEWEAWERIYTNESPAAIDTTKVVTVGDSQVGATYGWANLLADVSGQTVVNRGKSGNTPDEALLMTGGWRLPIEPVALVPGERVAVSFAGDYPVLGRDFGHNGYVLGKRVALWYTHSTGAWEALLNAEEDPLTLSETTLWASIYADFAPEKLSRRIVWFGGNSIRTGRHRPDESLVEHVQKAYSRAIDAWGETTIVCGYVPAYGDGTGRDAADALNSWLSDTVPTQFLDMRYRIQQAAPEIIGRELTTSERQDIANGYLPRPLYRSDLVHLTDEAHGKIAEIVAEFTSGGSPSLAIQSRPVAIQELHGTGSPEGKIAAAVGSTYTDRDATNGAIRWIKASGTGSTGWRVEYDDEAWRTIPNDIDWNTLAEPGRYKKRSGSVGGTNIPPTSTLNAPGELYVARPNSDLDFVAQIYMAYASGSEDNTVSNGIWWRSSSTRGVFSPWERLDTQDQIDSLTSRIQSLEDVSEIEIPDMTAINSLVGERERNVPTDADWNTLTEPGPYSKPSGSYGGTNLPPTATLNAPGKLFVTRPNPNLGIVTQLYLAYAVGSTRVVSNGIWWRSSNTNGEFSPWSRLDNHDDVEALQNRVKALEDAPDTGTPSATESTGDAYSQHEMRKTMFIYEMGGPISTGGKAAISFRFDHGMKNFAEKVLPITRAANLKVAQAVNPRNWARPENDGYTATDLNQWVADGDVEVWNHSASHIETGDAATQYDEIVNGLAELEAQVPAQGTVWGFMPPGTGSTYIDFSGGRVIEEWDNYPAMLMLKHHAVVTGYMPGTAMRVLDGIPRDGLGHYTLDKQTPEYAKGQVDKAIANKRGINFMVHPSLLDAEGYLTTAQFQEIVDYVVAKRDAGELVTLSPYEMLLADSRR